MSFADDLNCAVSMLDAVAPRVRFEAGLSPEAANWIYRKHQDGALHEPGTLGAMWAASKLYPGIKTIFDAGALFGYFSLFCETVFGGAEVTAFEMHPAAFMDLRRNVRPTTKCVNAVLSDVSRQSVTFWVSGFNIYEEPEGGWEKLAEQHGAMKERGHNNRGRFFARCNFITLDEYCASNKAPDLIKIDVEAYQAKAVLGGLSMIGRNRPVIIIELHDADKIARMGTTNAKTVQPLFDLGYQGYWCGNFRDKDATFEKVGAMTEDHERLSLMVFTP